MVSLTLWLGNLLRATTACTFSTSQLPKVVRSCGVFNILTRKCASRHNGVHLFISHLASWLRTRRFSEVTFRPSWATNHLEKHSQSRLSYLFAHLHLLSSHSFSSLIFSLLGFSSLTLLISAFPCVHIVGSLTSKLPSIISYLSYYIHIISYHIISYHLRAISRPSAFLLDKISRCVAVDPAGRPSHVLESWFNCGVAENPQEIKDVSLLEHHQKNMG